MTTRVGVEGVQKFTKAPTTAGDGVARSLSASASCRHAVNPSGTSVQFQGTRGGHIPCSHGPIPLPKGAVFDELGAIVPPGLKCDPGSCKFRVGSHQLLLAGTTLGARTFRGLQTSRHS